MGPELIMNMKAQAERFGARFEYKGRLDYPVEDVGGAGVFVDDFEGLAFGEDEGTGGDAVGEEDAGADGGAGADDGVAAHDGGVGVNGDVVFEGGMAALAAEGLSAGETAGDEGDALIEFDVVADDAGLADDDAGAVIDEEMGADVGAGMDVDAGAAMGPFSHHARDEGDIEGIKDVGDALDGDGFDEGIAEDDFFAAAGGGVALKGGLDVGGEKFAGAGDAAEKIVSEFSGLLVGAIGCVEAKALADFLADALGDAENAMTGEAGEVLAVDGIGVVKAGEEELEEVFADGGDGAFGGEVGAVDMVGATAGRVGAEDRIGDVAQVCFHGRGINMRVARAGGERFFANR